MPFAINGQISTDPIEGGIEITDAQYQAALAGMMAGRLVTIDDGFAVIDPPRDPEPEPPPEQPPSPPDLAPWQFRAMLRLSGKEADLLDFLDGLPEPARTVAKAKLEYTLVFHRDNDLVLAAQQALNLTEQELDGLWLQAASL